MKKNQLTLLCLLVMFCNTLMKAQAIKNASFEALPEPGVLLPSGWILEKGVGDQNDSLSFTVGVDNKVVKTGNSSIRISNVSRLNPGFKQTLTLHLTKPTKLQLKAFVRSDTPKMARLWYALFDGQREIAFAGTREMTGNGDWREMKLTVLVTPDIKQIEVGGDCRGKATVWFDDFSVEEIVLPDTPPSNPVKLYLDSAIHIAQKFALVRDTVPWQKTRSEMFAFAAGLQTTHEAHPVLQYMLKVLGQYGDNHSLFQDPETANNYSAAQPTQAAPVPSGKFISDKIGYVSVPGFASINQGRMTEFAARIQTIIRKLDSTNVISGWVVDLRQNTGGNMWPMVAGLMPLYGKDNEPKVPKNIAAENPYQLRNEGSWRVAILMDSVTASSGEFTALTFIGLPNVRTFGTHTAGYTTGNRGFKLSDGAVLYIASSVGEDRLGKKYPAGLMPDEIIAQPVTSSKDPALEIAKKWLQGK